MLKKILTIVAVVLMVGLAILRTGGGKYVNRYAAVGFVHSNTPQSAFMSFYTFEGRMSFKLKNKEDAGSLKCTGSLEEGDITVYYDRGNGQEEWFSLDGGDEANLSLSNLAKGNIYVIVETDGKCENGSLNFDME